MTLSAKSCLTASLVAIVALPVHADLRDCILTPGPDRADCVTEQFEGSSLDAEELKLLDDWIEADPASTLEVLQVLDGELRRVTEPSGELLDRLAEVHRRLGQPERWADRALEALEVQAGTRSLDWRAPDGAPRWSAALDCTSQRHVRAAAALLAVDRASEARSLLATALRLGVDGDAARLWSASGGGVVEGLDEPQSPILAPPWYPRLPRARVALAEGEPFVVDDARGRVLILDFWASWCEPCLKELPALGELFAREKQRGLEVLLINMGEAPEHALRFARRLGLQMPVGIYDEALEDAFGATTLPTVIVADRQGRVRARWDGYDDRVGEQVAALAERLLGPDADDSGEPLGQVLRGAELLQVVWARELRGEIDSLAVARSARSDGPPELVALAGRSVWRYERGGELLGTVERPRGSGVLRGGWRDDDGATNLLGFRVGGRSIAHLDPEGGEHASWESPAPLLDLAVVPAGRTTSRMVFLATLSGLYQWDADDAAAFVPGFPLPTGLALLGRGEAPRLAVLSGDRGLCTLDPANPAAVSCAEAGPGWRLVAGPAGTGTGILPRGVAATAGRFLDGAEGEVAAITSSSQLVILDAATGRERYRARLDGLRALAGGDLDGDGRDELFLGVRDRILVMKRRSSPGLAKRDDLKKE